MNLILLPDGSGGRLIFGNIPAFWKKHFSIINIFFSCSSNRITLGLIHGIGFKHIYKHPHTADVHFLNYSSSTFLSELVFYILSNNPRHNLYFQFCLGHQRFGDGRVPRCTTNGRDLLQRLNMSNDVHFNWGPLSLEELQARRLNEWKLHRLWVRVRPAYHRFPLISLGLMAIAVHTIAPSNLRFLIDCSVLFYRLKLVYINKNTYFQQLISLSWSPKAYFNIHSGLKRRVISSVRVQVIDLNGSSQSKNLYPLLMNCCLRSLYFINFAD